MKLCFTYYFSQYKPKGDILQFLILLKAVDEKVARLSEQTDIQNKIDCVLPFKFKNGQDGFTFSHVKFHSSNHIVSKIIELDRQTDYDFIFIRGQKEALQLIAKSKRASCKLVFLAIQHMVNDSEISKETIDIYRHSRIMFFQTIPLTERFKMVARQMNLSLDSVNRKIQVLPQFVERMDKKNLDSIPLSSPLQLIQPGVLRTRYGLPIALKAVRLIRKQFPNVSLHLAYPSIAEAFRETEDNLLLSPEIINHGQLSMWETKRKIAEAGIGLALIYDDTIDRNPTYSYLSRILEYLSLGTPFLTTKTVGNVHLLGDQYPLFVQDESDINKCYLRLQDPVFYQEMSRYVSQLGKQFHSDVAVEHFWSVLEKENEISKRNAL